MDTFQRFSLQLDVSKALASLDALRAKAAETLSSDRKVRSSVRRNIPGVEAAGMTAVGSTVGAAAVREAMVRSGQIKAPIGAVPLSTNFVQNEVPAVLTKADSIRGLDKMKVGIFFNRNYKGAQNVFVRESGPRVRTEGMNRELRRKLEGLGPAKPSPMGKIGKVLSGHSEYLRSIAEGLRLRGASKTAAIGAALDAYTPVTGNRMRTFERAFGGAKKLFGSGKAGVGRPAFNTPLGFVNWFGRSTPLGRGAASILPGMGRSALRAALSPVTLSGFGIGFTIKHILENIGESRLRTQELKKNIYDNPIYDLTVRRHVKIAGTDAVKFHADLEKFADIAAYTQTSELGHVADSIWYSLTGGTRESTAEKTKRARDLYVKGFQTGYKMDVTRPYAFLRHLARASKVEVLHDAHKILSRNSYVGSFAYTMAHMFGTGEGWAERFGATVALMGRPPEIWRNAVEQAVMKRAEEAEKIYAERERQAEIFMSDSRLQSFHLHRRREIREFQQKTLLPKVSKLIGEDWISN